MAKGLSVRQTEALVRNLKSEKKKPRVSRNRTEEIYLSGLAEDLSRHFGTKIMIKKTGQKGKVEIEFYSNDDLERLIQRLKKAGKE
jgi:ParB family chromosome partitioning protein